MTDPAPSKTELLERRGERDLVREGKSVLEERRDVLARMMWAQIGRVELLDTEFARRLGRARTWYRRAAARHGLTGLQAYQTQDSANGGVEWHMGNRFGTPWVERSLSGGPEHTGENTGQELSPSGSASLELVEARHALEQLLEVLLELAESEGNLVRLTHGFRRTQRRVNALEHIILPELDASIAHIQSAMDEVERDDLVRTSLIKRRHSD